MTFGQSAQAPDAARTKQAATSQDFMIASPLEKSRFQPECVNLTRRNRCRVGNVIADHAFGLTFRPAAIIPRSSLDAWSIQKNQRPYANLASGNIIMLLSTQTELTQSAAPRTRRICTSLIIPETNNTALLPADARPRYQR